jgi:hypothetical protein
MRREDRMAAAIAAHNRSLVGDTPDPTPEQERAREAYSNASWRRFLRERCAQARGEPVPPVPDDDLTNWPPPD